MTSRISRGGLLVILAFLVPVIVELRTLAGFLGIRLSTTQFLVAAVALVVAVLGFVAVWNMRADENGTNASGGV
ncbi:CbaC protein [Natronomonas halophila]|uniref:CbaC protein n=1 Tax=Natronomonas halophila TaxID=2747817 RepID=UPI0015B571D5|nr:CbaC protein [Natronomonas halophila]QLD86112.1 CbaC protein [Natronomonas halophila]